MRLLHFFQERFGFTRTELIVVMLLTASLLAGTIIRHFRGNPFIAPMTSSAGADSQFVQSARAFHESVRPTSPRASGMKEQIPGGPVDLNRATEAELVRLPGIGPAIARRILAYRKDHGAFGSIRELQKVRGIGPRTYERLRPLVRVSPRSR